VDASAFVPVVSETPYETWEQRVSFRIEALKLAKEMESARLKRKRDDQEADAKEQGKIDEQHRLLQEAEEERTRQARLAEETKKQKFEKITAQLEMTHQSKNCCAVQ